MPGFVSSLSRGVSEEERVPTGVSGRFASLLELPGDFAGPAAESLALFAVFVLVRGGACGLAGTLGVTTGSALELALVAVLGADFGRIAGLESAVLFGSSSPVKVVETIGRTPLVWEDEAE